MNHKPESKHLRSGFQRGAPCAAAPLMRSMCSSTTAGLKTDWNSKQDRKSETEPIQVLLGLQQAQRVRRDQRPEPAGLGFGGAAGGVIREPKSEEKQENRPETPGNEPGLAGFC